MAMNNEELADVLTEFYQRNRRERVLPTGVPKPFEIQTSVSSLGQLRVEEPRRVEEVQMFPQDTKVAPETEYNFFGAGLFPIPTNQFQQVVNFSGHNAGFITVNPVYIRIVGNFGSWGIVAPGPGARSGQMVIGFNTSTWTPPSPPNFVTLDFGMSCLGLPTDLHGTVSGVVQAQFYIQDSVTGAFATTVFGSWPFTPGNPGIISYGTAVTFTFP